MLLAGSYLGRFRRPLQASCSCRRHPHRSSSFPFVIGPPCGCRPWRRPNRTRRRHFRHEISRHAGRHGVPVHQMASFLGACGMGGYLYELFGTYNPVWWLGVAPASSPRSSTGRPREAPCARGPARRGRLGNLRRNEPDGRIALNRFRAHLQDPAAARDPRHQRWTPRTALEIDFFRRGFNAGLAEWFAGPARRSHSPASPCLCAGGQAGSSAFSDES